MSESLIEQLDEGIEELMLDRETELAASDSEVRELLAIAAKMCALPNPDFKARLGMDLLERRESMVSTDVGSKRRGVRVSVPAPVPKAGEGSSRPPQSLPTLFVSQYGVYPVQRSSFMASLGVHAAAIALIVTSGIWAAQGVHEKPKVSSAIVTDISYVLPPALDESHGGGGGGDRDILQASKGTPPRFAYEQMTPPAIVVRTEQPKLPAEPTVVGPPSLSFPQTSRMGDPLSGVLGPPSNGIGSSGGIGSGRLGGIGPRTGPGVGDGWGGGIGSGPYRVGGGVSEPHPIHDPEPEYSEEARKAKYQGVVTLQVIIGADGIPRDVRIARSLGMGLDEKAMQAVRQWRFEPGRMNGRPVPVVVNVEVNFRLY